MRTILLMLMLLPALTMAQTEVEITETWLAAEVGMAGDGEKAILLKHATIGARVELREFVKNSYEAVCKKREAYQSDPDSFAEEMDRINEEWHRRRLAHYNAIRNLLNASEEASFDNRIAESMSSSTGGENVASYSELLVTGRTTVVKSLNRICGEQK